MLAATNVAHYAAMLGDWDAARQAAADALGVASRFQYPEQVTVALHALAVVLAGREQYTRAARLLGFCNARFNVLHAPREANSCEEVAYRKVIARLENALDAGELEKMFADGALLNEQQAVSEAFAA
jgi:hypothetical protein